MGEIKSTIELVMERTRNLTMTEEERKNTREKEWSDKARGWVRKYLDGMVALPTVKSNLDLIERELPSLKEVLQDELRSHLQWDGDNERVLALFPELLGVGVEPFAALIAEYRTLVKSEWERRREALREALQEKAISGPAVVPNPAADESWQSYLAARNDLFRRAVCAVSFPSA